MSSNRCRYEAMNEIKHIRYPLMVMGIWAVFILPSVFFPNWCYLDDPTNLWVGATIAEDPMLLMPTSDSGRFRPAYNLYYAIFHQFFGFNLRGFYLVQSLVFLIIAMLAFRVVAGCSKSPRWGLAAAFLVLTSSPVAENAYTLGKADPILLLLLLLMSCCCAAFRWTGRGSRAAGIADGVAWLAWALLAVVALLFKETAVVFVVFAFSGVVAAWLLKKVWNTGDADSVCRTYLRLLTASLVSIGIVRLTAYLLVPPDASSEYTTYPITMSLVLGNLEYYLTQTPDVILMGLAAGAAGLISLSALVRSQVYGDIHRTVFSIALFMTGAAYMGGQLIWRVPMGYYLLIPAALFSIAGILFASMAPPASSRRFIIILGGIFFLTRLYSVPYFIYIARAQIAQDKIFTDSITNYMSQASPGQRLLAVDWAFWEEPVIQANILVRNIHGRENLQVTGIKSFVQDLELTPEVLRLHGVTEIPGRDAFVPKQGDFILLDTGARPSSWVLRGVSPRGGQDPAEILTLLNTRYGGGNFTMERVSGQTFGWKGIEIHPAGIGLKDYTFGYELYQVAGTPVHDETEAAQSPDLLWEGRWEDGWIGRKAAVAIASGMGADRLLLSGYVPSHVLPCRLTVTGAEGLMKDVLFERSGPFALIVDLDPSLTGEVLRLELNVSRTFIPKALGENDDTRELGIWIDGWVKRSMAADEEISEDRQLNAAEERKAPATP